MRLRLVLCLAFTLGLATSAAAEDWKTASDGTLYDGDFVRKDETSGLIVMRLATGGRPGSPYAAWPKSKSPIALYALDCDGDQYIDLGLDYDGSHGPPKNWRNGEKGPDIKAGVGAAGTAVCAMKDTVPKVALP
jgi:hypothetical protein